MTEIREPSEAVAKIAGELCAEFPGVFSSQTVERFVLQSFPWPAPPPSTPT